MKERGMIFNADMVRAILDGRKMQTRRPVKFPFLDINMGCELAGNELSGELAAGNYWNSPFGQPGDRLWVRETWSDVNLEGAPALAYRADDEVYDLMEDESLLDEDGAFNYQDPRVSKYHFAAWYSDLISGIEGNWRPAIHMPRWASRITLEITGVRVERLKDISASDALDEGIQHMTMNCPRHEFFQLWNSIYGDMAHETNPWIWVITFRRVA